MQSLPLTGMLLPASATHGVPQFAVLHYRGGSAPHAERSVRGPMPDFPRDTGPTAAPIAASAMALFRKLNDALPCSRLSVAAADFRDLPAEGAAAAAGSIARFFGSPRKKQKTSTAAAAEPESEPQQLSVAANPAAASLLRASDSLGSRRQQMPWPPTHLADAAEPAAAPTASVRPTYDRKGLQRPAAVADAPAAPGDDDGEATDPPAVNAAAVSVLPPSAAALAGEPTALSSAATCAAGAPQASGYGVDNSGQDDGGRLSEPLLVGVDVREQQRILHEIEIQRLLAMRRPPAGSQAGAGSGGSDRSAVARRGNKAAPAPTRPNKAGGTASGSRNASTSSAANNGHSKQLTIQSMFPGSRKAGQ